MAKDIEHYHRKFLDILRDHAATMAGIRSAGHGAIRALVEEIHDQGYVLGQLHADGIFPEGEETEVAERENRLCIPELKARARAIRQGQEVDRVKDSLDHLTGQGEAVLQPFIKSQSWCDTCSDTGWCKREGQIGVPGSSVTHGCPDCEVGRTRLARGELLEPDAYGLMVTE